MQQISELDSAPGMGTYFIECFNQEDVPNKRDKYPEQLIEFNEYNGFDVRIFAVPKMKEFRWKFAAYSTKPGTREDRCHLDEVCFCTMTGDCDEFLV